eukprot:6906096-Pyramimonas_sp.AAC.1
MGFFERARPDRRRVCGRPRGGGASFTPPAVLLQRMRLENHSAQSFASVDDDERHRAAPAASTEPSNNGPMRRQKK